jgi:hypothetical protein
MLAISVIHKPMLKGPPLQVWQHSDIGILTKQTPISDLSAMAIAVTSAD